MVEVIPAILAKSAKELEDSALEIESAPIIHIDELEDDVWEPLEREFEVHLMRDSIGKFPLWVERGARRIVVHELNEEILSRRHEVEIGLGIELNTPLEKIFHVIPLVDYVHLMSIETMGAQGRSFETKIFDRIKTIQEKFPEVILAVDGGVTLENTDELVYAGVQRLIVGSAIMRDENPEYAYKQFIELASHVSH